MIQPPDDQVAIKYSHATDPAIQTLMEMIVEARVDIVMLNFDTIARNVIDHTLSIDAMTDMAISNSESIQADLCEAFRGTATKNAFVCTYSFPYERMLPEEWVRPIETNKERRTLAAIKERYARYIYTHAPDGITSYISGNVTSAISIELNKRKCDYSYNLLRRYISVMKNMHRPVFFTHQPLDYHILHHYKKSCIVESVTGEKRMIDDLGKKLFKNPNIKFTLNSHVALGDKNLIIPSIVRKEKSELLAMAEKEHWDKLTTRAVDKKIEKSFELPFKMR